MLFNLENFWLFVLAIAVVYSIVVNFIQNNLGGKGRMKSLQKEMVEVQKKMIDSAKSGRDSEYKEQTEKYNKLTFEMLGIQMKMTAIFIVLYFPMVAFFFPALEPGIEDDAHLSLHDDGLASHCDALARDGIFSGCYAFPEGAVRGAWVASAYLNSSDGSLLARQDAPVYYGGGAPEDIWLQSASSSGPLDFLSGKKPYSLNLSSNQEAFSAGQAVGLYARPMQKVFSSAPNLNEMVRAFRENSAEPSADEIAGISEFIVSRSSQKTLQISGRTYRLSRHPTLLGDEAVAFVDDVPQGAKVTASLNSGTYFYVDLPFPLPLLNIRRIIGSAGVFIFFVFVSSIALSLARSAWARLEKK